MSILNGFKIIGYKFIVILILSMILVSFILGSIFENGNKLINFIFIIVFLIIIIMRISYRAVDVSGWSKLAVKYGTKDFKKIKGFKKFRFYNSFINGFNYSLLLRFNDEFIYLKEVIIFRFKHKPLKIPWSDIQKIIIRKALHPERKVFILDQLTYIGTDLQFAEIILKEYKDIKIELPWTDEMKQHVPKELNLEFRD